MAKAQAQKPKSLGAKEARKKKRIIKVTRGRAYIKATFNNTIITLTDAEGNAIASSSPGSIGFKGSRKSTPFAATKAAEDAVARAQKSGISEVDVVIVGPGPGRAAAVKGLDSAGLKVLSMVDKTPLPHNGCRPKKRRRV